VDKVILNKIYLYYEYELSFYKIYFFSVFWKRPLNLENETLIKTRKYRYVYERQFHWMKDQSFPESDENHH
jgi:hypothetical protein